MEVLISAKQKMNYFFIYTNERKMELALVTALEFELERVRSQRVLKLHVARVQEYHSRFDALIADVPSTAQMEVGDLIIMYNPPHGPDMYTLQPNLRLGYGILRCSITEIYWDNSYSAFDNIIWHNTEDCRVVGRYMRYDKPNRHINVRHPELRELLLGAPHGLIECLFYNQRINIEYRVYKQHMILSKPDVTDAIRYYIQNGDGIEDGDADILYENVSFLVDSPAYSISNIWELARLYNVQIHKIYILKG